jgi:hypothetical protein
MKYFQYQNVIAYTIDGTAINLTNIAERAKITARLNQHTRVMYDYVIADEQRPDTVALIAYGDVKYTWLILLMNNIFSLYDWPLTTREFTDFLISKYGSISASKSGTPTYYTAAGLRVDEITHGLLATAQQGEVLSPYEQEERDNEDKRRIRLVPSKFLSGIEQTLKTLYR